MEIVLNGQQHVLSRPMSIAELLAELNLPARGMAVEVNLQIVPRARHAEQLLQAGDRLEVVSLVGGG